MKRILSRAKKVLLILKYYILLSFRKVLAGKKQVIFLVGSPYKGNNLGDYAIDLAEKDFFNRYLPDCIVLWLPDMIIFPHVSVFKYLIGRSTILIHGGGFLGTLWMSGELMAREILKKYPNNKVIIMPQTIFFSDDAYGAEELQKSKAIYTSHKKLTIFARDEKSLRLLNEEFKGVTVHYVPDIVTSFDYHKKTIRKNQVVLCLRRDKENVKAFDVKKLLEEFLIGNGFSLEQILSDNVIDNFSHKYEKEKVFKQLDLFAESRLVVTDRLHGMLFAAVTSTPCVCIDNISGKVKGTYSWIKNNEYIRFVSTDEEFNHALEFLMGHNNDWKFDNSDLKPIYLKMADIIENK